MNHKNKVLDKIGNFFCRMFDIQMSKAAFFLLKSLVIFSGIFGFVLLFFAAMTQSLQEGAYNGFFNHTYIGALMIKHMESVCYQFLYNFTYPLLLINALIILPCFLLFSKLYRSCEDINEHERYEIYSEERSLTKLVNNLIYEGYHLSYGINDDDYYLETFHTNRHFLSKENIYIRVHTYKHAYYDKVYPQIQAQIKESYHMGNKYLSREKTIGNSYVIPIFLFEDTDQEMKKFIIKQYQRIDGVRLLPVLFCGTDTWWYHKRSKRPLILSIVKLLERSHTPVLEDKHASIYIEDIYFQKGSGRAYYTSAIGYYKDKKYKQANKYLAKSMKLAKNDTDKSHACLLMGICHTKLNQLEKSIETYQMSLKFNSKNHHSMKNLGASYLEIGAYENALSSYENYLAIYPDDLDILYDCSTVHTQLQQYNKAILLLRHALELSPTNPYLLVEIALAYSRIGDRSNALIQLNKANKIGDIDVDAYHELINSNLEELEK